MRREYTRGGLHRENLPNSPFELFELWLKQAVDAGLSDPTAMSVATVDQQGQPFQRIVLLKQSTPDGFVFYTNLGSRKALHLKENNQISALFPWHSLERQIHITGRAERLTHTEELKYFLSRPKESQLAAWASKQSARLGARQLLEAKFMEMKQKFAEGEIPLPSFWGGYRIVPTSIEFWQGGEHRLHDRFLYEKEAQGWAINRLAP